jgi:hypothetical protein
MEALCASERGAAIGGLEILLLLLIEKADSLKRLIREQSWVQKARDPPTTFDEVVQQKLSALYAEIDAVKEAFAAPTFEACVEQQHLKVKSWSSSERTTTSR